MPDEKFVAYIDILGFTKMVSKKRGSNAEIKLTNFNQSIYNLWMDMHFALELVNGEELYEINGFTYSDSLTIYTKNDSIDSLKKILEFVLRLYKISLFEHEIMLRGGLAKGKFNVKKPVGFENLGKNLFYGQAFIDAYNLESERGIKGCRFVFESDIKGMLNHNRIQQSYPVGKLEDSRDTLFDLFWINKNELCANNCEKLDFFYRLAERHKWSEHYSRTLDLFCLIAGMDRYDKYDLIKNRILESSRINRIM